MPACRTQVAYVESTREGKNFSVLIRYDEHRKCIVKQYEVELPGPILLGEGKPNNQNHAIIFTRGEAVQAIDMNQDGSEHRRRMQGFGEARGACVEVLQ